MRPISTSELPALTFSLAQEKQPYHAQANKIGWARAQAKPGASFDLIIKDGLGRVKAQRQNCKVGDSGEYGELINLPTSLGENLEVEVSNLKGAEKVTIFLN